MQDTTIQEMLITVPAELLLINERGEPYVPYLIPRDMLSMRPEERYGPQLAVRNARQALEEGKKSGADKEKIADLTQALNKAIKHHQAKAGLTQALDKQERFYDLTQSELKQMADSLEKEDEQ